MRLVHRRRFPLDHFVLIDDEHAMPPDQLVAEARRRAATLANGITGNAHAFTLVHNGSAIARRNDPHVHIFCTRSRVQKGLLYLVIGLKNLVGA